MYDDSIASNNYSNINRHNQQHWYDEPPYEPESDPDDFLMSTRGSAAATIQVGIKVKAFWSGELIRRT